MNWFKRLFIHSGIRYLIALGISLGMMLVYLLINGFSKYYEYINAVATGGIVTICVGGFSFLTYMGAFDTFGYGFAYVFGNRKKYIDLVDYKDRKGENRKKLNYPFIPYLVVGVLFVITSLIMEYCIK